MGSGYRVFTAGEVLTASNVQNYLQDQAVMVFGGTAARSSAIGTANFEEGMLTYLTDVDKLQVYTGAAFADVYPAAATNQGLTLINTTSFSGVTSVSLPANTFTATYKNYKIIFRSLQNTSTGALIMRLRAAGTDLLTGYTNGGIETGITENNLRIGAFGLTSWSLFSTTSGNFSIVALDLLGPQVANQTFGFYNAFCGNRGDNKIVAIQVGDSTSYDSMSFITSGGTITGTVEAYGYNV
jgi:hypothetical protein